jgi:hypothetical protein
VSNSAESSEQAGLASGFELFGLATYGRNVRFVCTEYPEILLLTPEIDRESASLRTREKFWPMTKHAFGMEAIEFAKADRVTSVAAARVISVMSGAAPREADEYAP